MYELLQQQSDQERATYVHELREQGYRVTTTYIEHPCGLRVARWKGFDDK